MRIEPIEIGIELGDATGRAGHALDQGAPPAAFGAVEVRAAPAGKRHRRGFGERGPEPGRQGIGVEIAAEIQREPRIRIAERT